MTSLRIVSAIALVSLSACTTPSAVKPDASVHTAQSNPACLTETGSRLPAARDGCNAIGSSYSRDDINRTGSTTAGGALRLMDPAISH